MRPSRYDFVKAFHRLVVFSHTVEFKRDLDIRAHFQRRRRRHQLVGGDDLVGLLQLLEKTAKRHRGQIARRSKVERQPEIDERRKLVALAAPSASKAVKRLRRALLRAVNDGSRA